jgi:spermidine/putrescine ABC transporter ATP-binding subunit
VGAARGASVALVELLDVRKHFGHVTAVDGVSLTVGEGEFFSVLGPSGSGKTTLLNLIGGFEQPSAGVVLLDGRPVNDLPPFKRPVNTVFQNYALFPHMTVEKNIAYPLRMAKVGRREIGLRVEEALAMVNLSGYNKRKPYELSGGQRQRVALARALVGRPRVILLDEPLGALDFQLRQRMQLALKDLQRSVGITFVYVTHDQGEALSMSDRIAVFSEGTVQQIGTPREIYSNPLNRFVAAFIGKTNFVVVERDGNGTYRLAGREMQIANVGEHATGEVTLAIRPEAIVFGQVAAASENRFEGTIAESIYLGESVRLIVEIGGGARVEVRVPPNEGEPTVGESVAVGWDAVDAVVLRD